MDLKGITWAADTYEKFEAMCLEAQEALYKVKSPFSSFVICVGSNRSFFKDTIKYLENQVQKAGVRVKTFYAEVLHSSSSCVGPLNDSTLSESDDPLMPYRDLDENTLCEVESVGEEAIASYQDGFDIEVIEKSTLEESCMLVEGDELHSVSQGSNKLKSYKKKIYNVLSLTSKSMRKQDPCISDHEDLSDKSDAAEGATSSALATDCIQRKLHDHSSCDFGWEFV